MTDRLYYTDPDLLEFEGTIVSVEQTPDGNYRTILDRSAFYPTSGGQSHDLGQLGQADVIDVVESDSGEVVHLTSISPGQVGEKVEGRVDQIRRMKNRQLHTAQHLLSQVFHQLIDGTTMSVHLGEEYGSIEFDKGTISSDTIAEAEREVNRMVATCLPVEIIFADASEVEKLNLRRRPTREGRLRIIKIGNIEATACGGTHCTNSGQVQLVKLIGTEPIRKRTMVKFLAGVQAIDDYSSRYVISTHLTKSLTCGLSDLPVKFDKLTSDIKVLKRELTASKKQLLPIYVEELIQQVEKLDKTDSIIAVISDDKLELGRQLALNCADKIEGLTLLISGERIFIACSKGSGVKAGMLMKALSDKTSIRGGGNSELAQGAKADPDQLAKYQTIILEAIS